MKTAHFAASLALAAVLASPGAVAVLAAPQVGVQVRVYDKEHKDYHNWDDNENHAWGQYLSENHKKSHDFKKARKSEQSDYWKWRHDHSDDRR